MACSLRPWVPNMLCTAIVTFVVVVVSFACHVPKYIPIRHIGRAVRAASMQQLTWTLLTIHDLDALVT